MYTHTVQIDEATTRDDFAAMERIQAETWSPSAVVPSSILMVTVESGGLALVARRDGEVIGFAFAVLAYDRRRVWYWSHMAAVLPGHRGGGVGAALKRRQYDMARERGVPLITWTFDPLQAGNANFNLHRLGAIVRRFLPDHYGEMDDPLNRGLPSDRFWCEWWVEPDGPRESPAPPVGPSTEILLAAQPRPDGLVAPHPHEAAIARLGTAPAIPTAGHAVPTVRQFEVPDPPGAVAPSAEARWAIEIPLDFQGMKARDMGLAKEWRAASGRVLAGVFAAGAVAVGFTRDRQRGVGTYLLVDGGSRGA